MASLGHTLYRFTQHGAWKRIFYQQSWVPNTLRATIEYDQTVLLPCSSQHFCIVMSDVLQFLKLLLILYMTRLPESSKDGDSTFTFVPNTA